MSDVAKSIIILILVAIAIILAALMGFYAGQTVLFKEFTNEEDDDNEHPDT